LRELVAVVTGGGSGIGRALCRLLGQEGARVGILDREPLDSFTDELRAAGVRAAGVQADVRDRAAVLAAIDSLRQQLGPIDILVACAGISGATLVDDLAVERAEAILHINLLGVAHTIDAVLPDMLARGSGQIVGISSLLAVRGFPFTAAYCASKAGIATYLESLRGPLRGRGIHVTVVFPGYVRTPLTERGDVRPPLRLIEPEQAAAYILRAILRRSRVCRFPWGLSQLMRILCWLPPRTYDRVMARGALRIKHLTY
jgi:NAD(P)-dependent dehydrogenase (short-subunit alcohol dehydrogenase family)